MNREDLPDLELWLVELEPMKTDYTRKEASYLLVQQPSVHQGKGRHKSSNPSLKTVQILVKCLIANFNLNQEFARPVNPSIATLTGIKTVFSSNARIKWVLLPMMQYVLSQLSDVTTESFKGWLGDKQIKDLRIIRDFSRVYLDPTCIDIKPSEQNQKNLGISLAHLKSAN